MVINSSKHSSELILCCRLQGHGSEDLVLTGSTFHLRDVRPNGGELMDFGLCAKDLASDLVPLGGRGTLSKGAEEVLGHWQRPCKESC